MSIKYRPEIDGLRAIAVVSVVLYHAEFVFRGNNPFRGGFIGVDIFFVISGFLITSIILKQVQDGNYSFKDFYERRARRILPALFAVMAASIPFAWKLMLPQALKEYAGSILSSLFFGSNIWFWSESSYWDAPSALKPFLHTWSLSIEEQFYVFFPILVLVVWKYAQQYLTSIFIIAFLVSLQMADHGSVANPDATFYLLHSRAWELLAGAVLAKFSIDYGRLSHPFLDATMPAVGLFLILNAIFFFNHDMKHPSFMTLLPVLGTVIIIWFANKGELVTDMLSTKVFVGLGLISYSLYLWHFPVFAFARIHDSSQTDLIRLALIGISLIIAIAAYYLIEQPFRKPKIVSRKLFFSLMGLVAVGLLAINTTMFVSGGLPHRFPVEDGSIAKFNAPNKRKESLINVEAFGQVDSYDNHKKIKVLVLGDSLSRGLWNSFYETEFLKPDASFRNFHAKTNCLVKLLNGADFKLAAAKHPLINKNCGPDFREKFERSKRILEADVIVWTQLFNNVSTHRFNGFGDYMRSLNPDVTLILANRNDIAFERTPYGVLVIEGSKTDREGLSRLMGRYRTEKRDKARGMVEAMAKTEGWHYIDISSIACGAMLDSCDIVDENGNLLYFDFQHWTIEGARYFGEKINKNTGLKQLILRAKDKNK